MQPFGGISPSVEKQYCSDRESEKITQFGDPRIEDKEKHADRDERGQTDCGRSRSGGDRPADKRKTDGGDGRGEQPVGRRAGQIDAYPVREQHPRQADERQMQRRAAPQALQPPRDEAGDGARAVPARQPGERSRHRPADRRGAPGGSALTRAGSLRQPPPPPRTGCARRREGRESRCGAETRSKARARRKRGGTARRARWRARSFRR